MSFLVSSTLPKNQQNNPTLVTIVPFVFFGRMEDTKKHFENNWPLVIMFTDLHRSFHYWSNLSNEFDNFNKSDDKITITIYESAMQNANCWRQFLFCMWNIIQIQLQNGLEGSVKSSLFTWFLIQIFWASKDLRFLQVDNYEITIKKFNVRHYLT